MHALRPLYLLCAALLVAALPQPGAEADIVQRVHFKADAKIIVWGESEQHQIAANYTQTAPKLHQTAHRLHAPIVQTGLLIPAHIQSLSSTPLETHPTSQANFNVASNTGFIIKAELKRHTANRPQLQNVPFSFELQNIGAKATAPASGETGNATNLADLAKPTIIYQSPMATAAQPGSIADQSLAFHAQWGRPVSDDPIDITFTVFRP